MSFFDTELTDQPQENTLSGLLQSFGQDLRDELINSLSKHGITSDSNLAQSINYSVSITPDGGYRFQLSYDKYGDFLDEGVQGAGGQKADGTSWRNKGAGAPNSFKSKRPRLRGKDATESLEVWANIRGINKWAVQESIYRQGIKPRHWFSDVFDDGVIYDLVNKIEQVGVKQIEIDLTEQLKGILNGISNNG